MKCIFCLKEKPPSEEHIFPEAIGGTLKTRRVCKQCNDFLGSQVDVKLTDHPFVLIQRENFGMKARSGKPINTFERLFREGVLAGSPNQSVKMVRNSLTGEYKPKLLYSRNSGAIMDISLDASDANQIPKIVQQERKRAGLPPLPAEKFNEFLKAAHSNIQTIDKPEVKFQIGIDIFEYKRAVSKICYELAFRTLGETYLRDKIAKMHRKFIREGDPGEIRGKVEFSQRGDLFTLWDMPWAGERESHLFLLHSDGRNITGSVRIFDTISGSLCVSENPSRYPHFSGGWFIAIDIRSGLVKESTLSAEFARLFGRGPTSVP